MAGDDRYPTEGPVLQALREMPVLPIEAFVPLVNLGTRGQPVSLADYGVYAMDRTVPMCIGGTWVEIINIAHPHGFLYGLKLLARQSLLDPTCGIVFSRFRFGPDKDRGWIIEDHNGNQRVVLKNSRIPADQPIKALAQALRLAFPDAPTLETLS